MTQTVFDLLDVLDGTPSVAGLGGEGTIYASSEELARDTRVVEVAVALCAEWVDLTDRGSAEALLIAATMMVPAQGARDLYDVLLGAEAVLPRLAPELEKAFRVRAGTRGIERDTALEGWTRLALGNWTTNTLHLRAQLQHSAEADDATPALVRALGAACSMWGDTELVDALAALSTHELLDSDAAMELGFQKVASAAASADHDAAREELDAALRWFDSACLDDARPDAVAFRAVIRAAVEQASGQVISDERFNVVADVVYEYLDGYREAKRGWRGARAGTTSAWLDLLTQLRTAASDRWFDTDTTLRALGRAFAAERTMVLVVKPGVAAPATQVGIRELVWPRIAAIAHENAAVVTHMRRWLASNTDGVDSQTRAAVDALLARLEETPPKKGDSESFRLPDAIRGNLRSTPNVLLELERLAAAEPSLGALFEQIELHMTSLNLAEDEVLSELLDQCDYRAEGGIGKYRAELTVLLTNLIKYAAAHLDIGQSTSRAPGWMARSQPWPAEHVLADHLNNSLVMAGRDSKVELPNVAGGRVDIAVDFRGRCRIYLEVKTVDQERSDQELVTDFGAQAVQYAATNIPVAILVVGDYFPRRVRRDIRATFHASSVKLDPASRQHVLITIRLQANVAPPSATSPKRITRKNAER